MVAFKTVDPMTKRERILFAQAFDIPYFESTLLRRPGAHIDRNRFGIGKDERVGEGRAARIEFLVGDAVIQEDSARTQEAPALFEIGRKHLFADMFDHTDACQFVERLRGFQLTIIPNLHPASILQTSPADALIRK